METAPVQSAGVAALTPPSSPGPDGVQASGDSFALTLGRALGTAWTPTQSAPSGDPKITQREKSAAADKSSGDPLTQAGLLVSFAIPGFAQPQPTVATGAGNEQPTADLKAPAVADLSASEATAQPSDGAASESASTASTRAALASVAALNALFGVVAQTLGGAGATTLEAPIPGVEGGGKLPTNVPSRGVSTPPSGPGDPAPARTLENQDLSAVTMAVGQQAAGAFSLAATGDLQEPSHLAPDPGSETWPTAVSPSVRLKEQRAMPAEGSTRSTTQGLQTLLTPTLPSSQLRQSGPVQAQETTQPPAIQGLQTALTSISLSSQPAQSTAASGEETIGTVHSDLAQVSSLLSDFAGVEVSLKVTGPESKPAGSAESSTSASSSVATDPAKGAPLAPLASPPQAQLLPNSIDSVADPTKGSVPSEPTASAAAPADASKTMEPEPASLLDAPPATITGTPTQHLDTGSRPVTPDDGLRKEAAVVPNAVQPSGGSPPASDPSAASGDPSDHAANGNGRPGQGGGVLTGENPPTDKAFASGFTSHATVDPTTNLLVAHAPESPVVHANTSTPQTAPPAGQAPATLAAWQNYQGSTGGMVRSAQLSDHVGGAEMHVELRSGTLGPLEVHAVVREGSVGAEIHVEGHDAHSALAASLPSLQQALGERNLRVESIAIYRDHVGGGMSGGERQGAHSSSSYSAQPQVVRWESAPQPRRLAGMTPEIEAGEDSAVGLSIRA
jgi:hypothetical protein